jgi:hypothetical protein
MTFQGCQTDKKIDYNLVNVVMTMVDNIFFYRVDSFFFACAIT